jgi:hypothetical protein
MKKITFDNALVLIILLALLIAACLWLFPETVGLTAVNLAKDENGHVLLDRSGQFISGGVNPQWVLLNVDCLRLSVLFLGVSVLALMVLCLRKC